MKSQVVSQIESQVYQIEGTGRHGDHSKQALLRNISLRKNFKIAARPRTWPGQDPLPGEHASIAPPDPLYLRICLINWAK